MHVDDRLEATRTSAGRGSWPAAAATEELAPATRLGAYLLLRKLGEGGMGAVYAAYHEGLDRKVAIKVVRRDRSGGTTGRQEVVREAQALARLSHPNVVQVHEVGEHAEQLFVAMELVHGETLAVWQRAPGRGLDEIVDAYRQAATGLRAAHEAGLVHRDFKPANVIVGVDGRVRVIDFGLASAPAVAAGALVSTGGEGLSGTPAYMSPEQFAGREVDARSDIFSLCVALWEALHGQRPFAGDSVEELRASVGGGRRQPPPAGVQLPERLVHALERGLAGDPGRRWDTLDPLIAALTDPRGDPSAAGRERRLLFIIVGGLLIVVLPPVLILGAALEAGGFRILYAATTGVGLLVLAGISLGFRRTLLRNSYHRRMILFVATMLLVITSQRLFAIGLGAPPRVSILDSAHIILGMSLTGAVFFARWMAVLAAIIAVAVLAAMLVPGMYPAGMVLFGPIFLVSFGYFWHSEARRGVDGPASDGATRPA